MPTPVRCFACSKQIPHNVYEEFNALREERQPRNEQDKLGGIIAYTTDVSFADFFDKKHYTRICCRTCITTSVLGMEKKIS